MKTDDFQLKLQAYLDGELSDQEAAEVSARLAANPEAQALLAELRNTTAALAGNETAMKLPESREFFWSKIEREIERQDRPVAPVVATGWMSWVQHHFLRVGGVAVVSCLLAVFGLRSGSASQFAEIDVASDDMGAYTYRDQQAKMTLVWFYDRNDDSQFTEPASLATVEPE